MVHIHCIHYKTCTPLNAIIVLHSAEQPACTRQLNASWPCIRHPDALGVLLCFDVACYAMLSVKYHCDRHSQMQEYFDVEAVDDMTARARGIKPETTAAIKRWMEENK